MLNTMESHIYRLTNAKEGNVIKKLFEINWDKLNSEFDSEKNKGRREKHIKTHNKEEKQLIFKQWKIVMQEFVLESFSQIGSSIHVLKALN